MHYANGREAAVNDWVIGRVYNTKDIVAGKLLSITQGPTCNCSLGIIGDAAQPVRMDYSQCDYLLRADDAYAAGLPPVGDKPAEPEKPVTLS